MAGTCPDCRGAGSVIRDPCPDCRGQGRRQRQRSIQVRVPGGVDTRDPLHLPGEGEHGRHGGPPGDLYVVIDVEPHERFGRRGADVLSSVTIGYPQAVLGCSVDIETLHGTSVLEVPPATAHGSTFVLRSEGIPRIDGRGRGNHIVEVRLNVPAPRDLSEDELEHLRALAELSGDGGGTIRDELGLFSRVKDLFSAHEPDTDPAAGGGGKAERGSEA